MEEHGVDQPACEECTLQCRLLHGGRRDLHCTGFRFFKVLIGGEWTKILLLPPAVAMLMRDKIGEEMELENANGEKWTVRLSSYDSRHGFLEGWKEFVDDHDLQDGDFLIFNYMRRSKFIVHVYGRTGMEKLFNNNLRRHGSAQVRESMNATERPIESPRVAPKVKPKPAVLEPSAFGSENVDTVVTEKGHAGMGSLAGADTDCFGTMKSKVTDVSMDATERPIESPRVALKVKSKPSVLQPSAFGTQNLDLNINTKEADVSITEKGHAGMGSLAGADTDGIGTMKSKVTDVNMIEKDCSGRRSLSKAIEDRINERMRARKMESNMHAEVTDATDKTQRSLLARKCRKKTSYDLSDDDYPFEFLCEEPGKKETLGDEQNSLGANNGAVLPKSGRKSTETLGDEQNSLGANTGAVLPKSGRKSTENLGNEQNSLGANNGAVLPKSGRKTTGRVGRPKKIVNEEQQESSEAGLRVAKRKRDFESAPKGRTDLNQVKNEPWDDTSAYQAPVTCLAVTHGQHLDLPERLQVARTKNRKSKAVVLVDQKGSLWPALCEEDEAGSQALHCPWDKFSQANGVQDGDRYVIAIEDPSQFLYRIDVLRQS